MPPRSRTGASSQRGWAWCPDSTRREASRCCSGLASDASIIFGSGCLENFSDRGGRHGSERPPIPEVFNPPGKPIHGIVPPPLVKIVGPQFAVRFIAGEHVKDTTHY